MSTLPYRRTLAPSDYWMTPPGAVIETSSVAPQAVRVPLPNVNIETFLHSPGVPPGEAWLTGFIPS
jgi:hypothetical protein